MTNGEGISCKANLKDALTHELQLVQNGVNYGNVTENGLKTAISYLDSVDAAILTNQQINHTVMLSIGRV